MRNWERFQHYNPASRTPPWIKMYAVALLRSDDYMGLPFATRGVLHGIWAHYAVARGVVSGDTLMLSRALAGKVYGHQLERLEQAGFIEFSASRPLLVGASVPPVREPETKALVVVQKKVTRPPDLLWDALAVALGDTPGERVTETQRGVRNRALKELREVGATPEQLRERAMEYRRQWPDVTLTAMGLVKHWAQMAPTAPHLGRLTPMQMLEIASGQERMRDEK